MFTVKWIADNGSHALYRARGAVHFTPSTQRIEVGESACPCVSFEFDDEGGGKSHITIDHGRIYVMNESGATVSSYVLRTEHFPHGINPE